METEVWFHHIVNTTEGEGFEPTQCFNRHLWQTRRTTKLVTPTPAARRL
jgi:hypothetical protein